MSCTHAHFQCSKGKRINYNICNPVNFSKKVEMMGRNLPLRSDDNIIGGSDFRLSAEHFHVGFFFF